MLITGRLTFRAASVNLFMNTKTKCTLHVKTVSQMSLKKDPDFCSLFMETIYEFVFIIRIAVM